MSSMPDAVGVHDETTDIQSEYILELESAVCFLCNKEFHHNEDSWLMFEKRVQESGDLDSSLAVVLSTALGKPIEENEVHSKFLCITCNVIVTEYEAIEHRFYQLKYKIVSDYNKMAKCHGLDTVVFEGIEEDEAVIQEDIVNDQDVEENLPSNGHNEPDQIETFSYVDFEDEMPAVVLTSMPDSVNGCDEIIVAEENCNYAEDDIKNENDVNREYFEEEQHEENMDILTEAAYEQIIEHSTGYSQDGSVSSSQDGISAAELMGIDEDSKVIITHNIKRKRKGDKHTKDERQKAFQFDGEKYECLMCITSAICADVDVNNFALHMKTFHSIRLYICELCNRGYAKRSELNDHFDTDHAGNDEGAYNCDACDRSFSNYRLLRIHKRMHYPSAKQFECNHCQKRYPSKNLLDEHINMHTGLRPFECADCPKTFASKYTLNAHMKIHTDRPRPFQCTQCSKAFLSAQNLNQHMKLHAGLKEFICNVCGKAFGTLHNMEVHKIVHSGNKPFVCRTCGKGFARRAEVQDHERTHTGERPFKCDVCEMSFAQRSNLTSHVRSKHLNDRRYSCTLCDRSFKRRRLLDYHTQAAHTGERPYKCEMCGATFVYPEHHKKHMRIHSGDKPYLCEVCGKPFSSRDNRNAHRFTHSDKKPYECLVCGMGFMRKPQLYNHMQQSDHVNDTIIVNQPRISKNLPCNVLNEASDEEDNHDVVEDFVIEDVDEGDLIATGSGSYIKPETEEPVGDVQYIQFSHKDEEGKDMMTWVNFATEKAE